MYKIKAGLVIVDGERFGCIVEMQDGCENFAHLANGECFNESEVDKLEILENELNVDVEALCEKIESNWG